MRGQSSRHPKAHTSVRRRGEFKSKDSPDAEIILPYSPFPKQNLFHACDAEVVLFGGSAGPGKSYAMLMDALIFVLDHPGATAMLMRRKYPELEGSLIKESLRSFPEGLGRYNDAKHRWTIDCGPEYPNSFLEFGHCERSKDVYNYRSVEWQYLGIDESTSFTREMFDELFTRVRSTLEGVKCLVRMCSNPGNIGHGWHKEFFGIGREETPPGKVWRPAMAIGDKYPPPTRCFIPATIFDNPALMKNDPGYLGRLEGLKEAKKRMLLYGEWGGYAGQYFTEFDEKTHVIKPRELPLHWKRYRAVDWGFQKPFACHWYAVDEKGHAYIYREAYKAGILDQEQARLIKEVSINPDGTPEIFDFSVADPAMCYVGSKDTGKTSQQNYQKEGVIIFPGKNKRVAGWTAVRDWLAVDPATGTPWLQIFDTCPDMIRELGEALCDEGNPEDVNSDCSDHAIDDLRYWAMAFPAPSKALPKNDPRARLDEGSRAEWATVDKLHQAHAKDGTNKKAVLHGLNDWGL